MLPPILHHWTSSVPTPLDYLIFDYSEDDDGNGTWDAMASVPQERLDALRQEAGLVLRLAQRDFKGRHAALDDGGDWDFDLQAQDENGAPVATRFDVASGELELAPAASGRVTLSLSLSGNAHFAAAFNERFQLDD